MRLYLDTADPVDWEYLMPTGAFYGITTNPLLISQLGLNYGEIVWEEMVSKAADLGAKELHIQTYGDVNNALSFGKHIYDLGRSLDIDCVIKIPFTLEGILLSRKIKEIGAKILMTACYEPKQMITACALKADYIAPYFGRMMDEGLDAMAHMKVIEKISRKSTCVPVVASLRNVQQLTDLAAMGHNCFTISPDVARDLFGSKFTDAATIAFETTTKGGKL